MSITLIPLFTLSKFLSRYKRPLEFTKIINIHSIIIIILFEKTQSPLEPTSNLFVDHKLRTPILVQASSKLPNCSINLV